MITKKLASSVKMTERVVGLVENDPFQYFRRLRRTNSQPTKITAATKTTLPIAAPAAAPAAEDDLAVLKHELAPFRDMVLGGQLRHVLEELLPIIVENVPTLHKWQYELLTAAVMLDHVPAVHDMHWATDVAAMIEDQDP